MSLRMLLPTRQLKSETSGLLIGSNGDLSPVLIKTRDLGGQVEIMILVGEAAEKAASTSAPMKGGPIVAFPQSVKETLRDRVAALGAQKVAAKIGCSEASIYRLINGKTECRKALLDGVLDYIGDLGNA